MSGKSRYGGFGSVSRQYATDTAAEETRSAAATTAGATILAVVPATAQRHDPRFPFCMERLRSGRSSTIDCRFTSMDQCRMTASGLRARCFPNPNWRGSR